MGAPIAHTVGPTYSPRQCRAINLMTAKQIGITIPQSVLCRADDIIK